MPGKKKKKFDLASQKEVLSSAEEDPNYIKQIATGAVQGAGDIADIAGTIEGALQYPLTKALGTGDSKDVVSPGQAARHKAALGGEDLSEFQQLMLLMDDDDIMPPQRVPGGREAVSQALEKIPEGGPVQEATRRITRSAPGLLGGPLLFAEMAARDLAGLGGKKIAEKMGFGETGQAVFDLGFSLAPNPREFIGTGSKLMQMAATGEVTTQKKLVEAARKMGWSEKEIAPLVREGWFANTLKKISPKGAATERALDRTAAAVTSSFEHVKGSQEALTVARQSTKNNFIKRVESLLPDMTEKAKQAIGPELQTLYKGEMRGKDLIGFWQKLNRYFKELPELQAFKGPTGKAIREISSNLANNFEMANSLSQRFRTVSKGLKPNLLSQLISAGEIGVGLKSLLSFQLPLLAVGVAGTRKIAELMTTNPRFMNLHKKMLTSINTGQAKAAEKIMNSMIGMVAKDYPEVASEIRKTSMEELRELLQAASMEEDID